MILGKNSMKGVKYVLSEEEERRLLPCLAGYSFINGRKTSLGD